MLQKMGLCNDCGQCCGCETAPNRMSPFPRRWPEAVRNWTVQSLAGNAPVFQITGHPEIGGARAGAMRVSNKTFRWIWVVGHGLNADAPPWGDESSYEPQCPFLLPGQQGVYPCGAEGHVIGDAIRNSLGCREIGMPEFLEEASWEQYITDHPNCSLDYQPLV